MAAEPPSGFETFDHAPFLHHVGPVYRAVDDVPGEIHLGIQIDEIHRNSIGVVHGGLIATVVDVAMARAHISKLKRRTVTLKMTLEYIDAVRIGDWMVAHARLTTHDDKVAHTECTVRVGEVLKAQGTGVFRLLRPF